MRCTAGTPKLMFSLKIGPYLSNSRSCTLYCFVKRSDLTKTSANDFKVFRGPGMSSKGRTEVFSVSDFAASGVWLSSSGGIALVFWNLRRAAKGFKYWDLGRFLLKLILQKAYMFSICCTVGVCFGSRGHETTSKPGLVSKSLVPVPYRHISRWRTCMSFCFFYISGKVYLMVFKSGCSHCFCG